jgi:hypothetical protein
LASYVLSGQFGLTGFLIQERFGWIMNVPIKGTQALAVDFISCPPGLPYFRLLPVIHQKAGILTSPWK